MRSIRCHGERRRCDNARRTHIPRGSHQSTTSGERNPRPTSGVNDVCDRRVSCGARSGDNGEGALKKKKKQKQNGLHGGAWLCDCTTNDGTDRRSGRIEVVRQRTDVVAGTVYFPVESVLSVLRSFLRNRVQRDVRAPTVRTARSVPVGRALV